MKCSFQQAAPTGKGCSARVGEQLEEQIKGDGNPQRGQDPRLEGLDVHWDPQGPLKAFLMDDRANKMERNMGAPDNKFDFIIENMKKANSGDAGQQSDSDYIVLQSFNLS